MTFTRRSIILSVAGAALAVTRSAPQEDASALQPNPTAQTIQTQIADLQATLTAIPKAAPGTPTVAREFDFTGEFYGAEFHVKVGRLVFLGRSIHDEFSDGPIYPKGNFVSLDLTMTNTGNEPVPFWEEGTLLLRDDRGRAFSPDANATSALTIERDLYVPEWQPGIAYDAIVVWDVAPDALGFSLEVEDTDISIPLI